MGAETKIGWTHSTFNAWHGCVKISPACTNCYAAAFDKRTGHANWGLKAPRRFFGEKHWAEPLKWNASAQKAGERRRVFCGSMMDVFELHSDLVTAERQQQERERLFTLIHQTRWLDWLLLTKRPENAAACLPLAWMGDGLPPNVWMGTTVENQEYADLRIPHLLKIPVRVRFLSCEPLLGPIDVSRWLPPRLQGDPPHWRRSVQMPDGPTDGVSWVIAGGESGAGHREHQLEWSRSLRDQCADAGVAYFFKQLGEAPTELDPYFRPDAIGRLLNPAGAPTRHRLQLAPRSKGESLDEIPADLRIREFPTVTA
jgi:protein gp37